MSRVASTISIAHKSHTAPCSFSKKGNMRRTANYEVKNMYHTLIADFKPKVGEYTKYNTLITEELIEVLENRLLQITLGDLV